MNLRVLLAVASFSLGAPATVRAQTAYGLDLNQNGLSDLFERLFPSATTANADTDGDGQTNRDEAAAGTDPTDSSSVLGFLSILSGGGSVTTSWESVVGKRYQVQASSDLLGEWRNEGNASMGTGEALSAACPSDGSRLFLRLNVADTDSDGDGVTDWEETIAGTNPSGVDTDGDGLFDDLATLSQLLGGQSTLTVYASDALANEAGANTGTFRVVRRGALAPLIATFTLSGSASAADYSASPVASVYFPLGASSATVTVSPVADAEAETSETVTLTLSPGAEYALGTDASATVTIEDPASSSGTGLLGLYYDRSNTTFANSANFNPLDLRGTRVDPEINFDWGQGRPHPDLTDDDLHSVRWTGQIQPQFSETYTFYTQANGGSRLTINGQILIDVFNGSASGVEQSATVDLEAGHRYDIKLEYQDQTGSSHMYLRWSSASQPKQIIPASRLYPFGGAAPAITSLPFAVGIIGGPFSYTITASNAPASFAADGLPAGLSLDPATGRVTGTPTGPAGLHHATISATNPGGTGSAILAIVLLGTGGALTHDTWTNLNGSSIQSVPLATAPTSTALLTTFESPPNTGDNFGDRFCGFLTAPSTGHFTFFIATADENAELWVSASDDPARRLKRCWVQNGAPAGAWKALPTQRALPMHLVAGQRYYFEALRKEAGGDDQLLVGWLKPGQAPDATPEVIPGFCLSPYVPPPPGGSQSTLYIATLTPRTGVASLGSGAAVMTVNSTQTEARLTVSWANLTGPKTQLHVHDASQGDVVIFDFNTSTPDPSGAYLWTFAPTGQHTIDDIRAVISSGQAFVNVHTADNPDGEIKGFLLPATGSRTFVPPPPPPALPGGPITDREAARFLNQATFGLSGADADSDGILDAIAEVKALGYEAWIDKQMDETLTPPTYLRPQVTQFNINFPRAADAGVTESANEIWRFWWKTAVTAPDQLRHRVAFALSQILVVSEEGVLDEHATGITAYHDLLASHSFGDFRSLLENVTLNYSMGRYLDMAGNRKPDPSVNRTANENYAREILQLFSIGLKRLHPDGTVALGNDGLPVATYDQDVVVGLANNFTGWNNDPMTPEPFTRWRYTTPMTLRPNDHFNGDKLFLDSTIIPARVDAAADLRDSHDVLFHHACVGPFITRLLIQRLVTANPSPGYIYRAARVFDDDGTGQRGNLRAVVKAILLDYEARSGEVSEQPGYGHLREPALRATHVLRALHGRSMSEGQPMATSGGNSLYSVNPAFDSAARQQTIPRYLPLVSAVPSPGWDMGTEGSLGQTPLRAPTVFNYFEPDYVFPGNTGQAGLFGPEFQITSETTIINFANWFYTLVRDGQGQTTNWDAEPWQTQASATPPTALDINGVIYRYNTVNVNTIAYPETPRADTEGADVQLDLTQEKALAYDSAGADTSEALLDRLNLLLMENRMEKSLSAANPNMYYLIWNYLRTLPHRIAGVSNATAQNESDDRIQRVRDALHLIITSPDFNVQK